MVIDVRIHLERLCPKEVINRLHKATKSQTEATAVAAAERKTVNCKHAPLAIGNVGNAIAIVKKRSIKTTTTTANAEYSIMIIIFATESNL